MDYNEDSDAAEEDRVDDEYAEGEGSATVSVSSRGRVRKIIAKARRIFRD